MGKMTDQQRQALTELRDWMEKWDAEIQVDYYPGETEINIAFNDYVPSTPTTYTEIPEQYFGVEEIDKLLNEEDE